MFYCHSGYNDNAGKYEILWACDNDDEYSLYVVLPLQIDGQLMKSFQEDGRPISSLSEIQQYVDSLDYTWDEPCWDIYDENLEYVRSVPRLA